MMNLYREEERERVSIIDRIKDLKDSIMLNIKTSSFARNKSIKKATKAIHEVDPKNTEFLNEIYTITSRLDLFDSRYGKTINFDTYNEFVSKLKENGNLPEILKSVEAEKVCFREIGTEKEF